jgi:hypothetical protein
MKITRNSVKVTNYLNTQSIPDALFVIITYLEIMEYFFDWIRKTRNLTHPFIFYQINVDLYKLAFKNKLMTLCNSVTPPQDILSRVKFLCINKKLQPLKIAKQLKKYKMPLSKRILIFCCIIGTLFASHFC